jgi:hypothetical protein
VRAVPYGAAVRVRFRLSDDGYAVVGRVNSEGRLTILFPASRTGRSFVRAHQDIFVRGRQSGSAASFYASDQFGEGYVFAIASYEPLDLTRFTNADFGFGSASAFQAASRRYAYRPDEMLERFASWVLYDPNSPFDYDIDYYSVDAPRYANAASVCYAGGRFLYDDWDVGSANFGVFNRYGALCRGFYNSYLACLGLSIYNYYSWCAPSNTPIIVRGPNTPATPTHPTPTDSTEANIKVIRGGQWQPDTVARIPIDDKRGDGAKGGDAQGRPPRSTDTQQWDHIYSIPRRPIDDLQRPPLDDPRRKDAVPTRNERGFVEPDSRGASPTPPRANEVPPRRAADTRGNDVPPRDGIGDTRRRFGGSSDAGAPPRETPPRTNAPPPREAPATYEAPRRTASPPPREPMIRADPAPQRTAPPAAPRAPSKPTEEPRKPPEEPRKPPPEEPRKPPR